MLPTWKVEPAKRKGFVKMTCPRKTCKGVIWAPATLVRGSLVSNRTAAPCPHCFKAAKLPS